jgi:hypothetical protein
VEGNALNFLVASADTASSDYEQGAEHLLCEAPVPASAPAADIARAEEAVCDDPGVLRPLARAASIEGDRHVEAATDPGEPSSPGQVAQELAGILLIDAQNLGCFAHVEGAMGATVQLL